MLMTSKQVAERFRVSSATILNWRDKGILTDIARPVREGARHFALFDSAQVNALTREQNGHSKPGPKPSHEPLLPLTTPAPVMKPNGAVGAPLSAFARIEAKLDALDHKIDALMALWS